MPTTPTPTPTTSTTAATPTVAATSTRSYEALAESLRRQLLCLRPDQSEARLSVAALGLRDELTVDEALTDAGFQAVPVFLDGRLAIVGPLRPPGYGRPGCSRCLARRWQLIRPTARRDAIERVRTDGAQAGRPRAIGRGGMTAAGEPPFLTGFAATMLAGLVAAALRCDDDGPYPYVYAVDLATSETNRTRLVPDPDCPTCGDPCADTPDSAVVELARSPKPAAGTFRLRAPSEVDLPTDALSNDVCGMVSASAAPVLSQLTTAPVSGSFAQRCDELLYEVRWGGHTNSFAASRFVGVIEGLERHAGVVPRGRRAFTRACLSELGELALDPRACGVYSDEFYAGEPDIEPFSVDRPIEWVWGYSLRDERPILVPLVLTYYQRAAPSERFVQECSNGCASGTSLVEAVYYGLCEVVERDAFVIGWYGRASYPEIDPQTSTRAETRMMVDRLAMYGYRARFFDARVTFPIPVVVSVAERVDGGLGALCFGAGAGLDPEDALAGALGEIATVVPFLPIRTQQVLPRLRAMASDFTLVRALPDHPLLYGLPEMRRYANHLLGPRPASADPPCSVTALRPAYRVSTDLAEDVRFCLSVIAEAGFDVIVVNQTTVEQEAMGLNTVSVLIPGLVPIDFGWRRQRALSMPRVRSALPSGLRPPGPIRLNAAPHPFP
jgi:ribosomal protein S12 methylthiotransferase accessory factor